MKNIEGSPFIGNFQGFGTRSFDSVAGLLRYKTEENEQVIWKKNVVKWNRKDLGTANDAMRAAIFKHRSIELYRSALGFEHIVPTAVVVGNKNDRTGIKCKVFQVQPYIDGWTGGDVPDDVREDPFVRQGWGVLGGRLAHLYKTAIAINAQVPDANRFPIALTVGNSRQKVNAGVDLSVLPATKNMFIDKITRNLSLFDFGEYFLWNDTMQKAFADILDATRIDKEVEVFNSLVDIYQQQGEEAIQELISEQAA